MKAFIMAPFYVFFSLKDMFYVFNVLSLRSAISAHVSLDPAKSFSIFYSLFP